MSKVNPNRKPDGCFGKCKNTPEPVRKDVTIKVDVQKIGAKPKAIGG